MTRNFVLYTHSGSGNHGCEALVRTTVDLLKEISCNNISLVSYRDYEDKRYGIDNICKLVQKGTLAKVENFDFKFFKSYFNMKFLKKFEDMDLLSEASAASVKKGDVALSIGGDNYCYEGSEIFVKEDNLWRFAGLKTVLWGCSVEEYVIDNTFLSDNIKKYDLITARESISYKMLKSINPNTVLVSDSAFVLKSKKVALEKGFENREFVGLNFSSLVQDYEISEGIAKKNIFMLLEYIFAHTDMDVMLVPHVVQKNNDDRVILKEIYEKYKNTGRILLINDCSCEELKGYISHCRFFVGARTHSTIASYSLAIPTLVLGYSVKSLGIAKDLFGNSENYVLPVQNLGREDDLLMHFKWLLKNENNIKETLVSVLPEYKNRVYDGIKALQNICLINEIY